MSIVKPQDRDPKAQVQADTDDATSVVRHMEDFETNDEDEWKLVKHKGSQKGKDTLKALAEDTVPMRITSIKVKGSNETDNSHHESKKLCKLAYSQINVCRYFQNGKCKFGSKCINFHGRSICL